MKLVRLTFQFQYADAIEGILVSHGVQDYIHHQRAAGQDCDGRHDGSQAFPGVMASIEALVGDDLAPELLESLSHFRREKRSHAHLRATVLPVEQAL